MVTNEGPSGGDAATGDAVANGAKRSRIRFPWAVVPPGCATIWRLIDPSVGPRIIAPLTTYLVAMAVALAAHQIMRECRRPRRPETGIGPLVAWEHLSCVLLLVGAGLAWWRPIREPWLSVALLAALIPTTFIYGWVSAELKDALLASDQKTLTQVVGDFVPMQKWLAAASALESGPASKAVARQIARLTRYRQSGPSPLSCLILNGLVSAVLGVGGIAGASVVRPSESAPPNVGRPAPSSQNPTALPSVQNHTPTPPAGGVQQPSEPAPTVPVTTPVTFDQVCGTGATLPGEGATGTAQKALYALWFAPGSGAGAIQAGCPDEAVNITLGTTSESYQASYHDGSLAAVAVYSGVDGGVLLYGSVGKFALEQLRSGMFVLAEPRENIGAGDGYLLTTAEGTFAFLRDEKHPTDEPNGDTPYVELPPAVTAIWAIEIQINRRWLWPIATSGIKGEDQVFELSPLPGEYSSDATVQLSSRSRQASTQGFTVTATEAESEDLQWNSVLPWAPPN